MEEMSAQSLSHLNFLTLPKVFLLQVEIARIDSEENNSLNEHRDSQSQKSQEESSNKYGSHNDSNYGSAESSDKMKLKNNNSVNRSEEEVADLSLTQQKETVFRPVLIRLQPTILGYQQSLDHYVLVYSLVDENRKFNFDKYKVVNKKKKNDNDISIDSNTSSVNVLQRKNEEDQDDTIIDLLKLKSVIFQEEDKCLILEMDTAYIKETKIRIKIEDIEIARNYEKSLRFMINLVKLKAIIFKVKQTLNYF